MKDLARCCRILRIACNVAAERLVALEMALAVNEVPNRSALSSCLDAIGALARAANQTYPTLLSLSVRQQSEGG